jgi:hypothetical protein
LPVEFALPMKPAPYLTRFLVKVYANS